MHRSWLLALVLLPSVGHAEEAPSPPAFATWSPARLVLELDLVTQARWTERTGDDLTELRLDRGELGARVALGPQAAAELRVEAIRSAVEGGALGIDGDSTVMRVKYAQVTGVVELGDVQLGGALGFVPDPWLRTLEDGYTLRPLSRTGSERLLAWPTSDLSTLATATLGPVRASVTLGNGEGVRYPERNGGKTTTAVLEVVALHQRDLRIAFAGVGRDGSIGVARVRDRRAGGGATMLSPYLRVGVEAVRAWGLGDRGELVGTELAGWAEGRLVDHLFLGARGATLGLTTDGRRSTFGGALCVEPWVDTSSRGRSRLRVWLGVDRVTSSGDAMPIPGADGGDATVVMLIASATAPFTLD